MSIKALYTFKGYSEFSEFSSFTEIENWKIEKQLLINRVEKYQKKPYFKTLLNRYKDSQISIWDLKKEEVITWIDTMVLLKRFFVNLFKLGVKTEEIEIIMEYPLRFGNHTRADYLLVFERLIIILEFGMFNQDERRREERYTKKLQESMNYRRILANLLPKEVELANCVMIYRPEYDNEKMSIIDENVEYNNTEINNLLIFIKYKIEQQIKLKAKNQLDILSDLKL